MKVAVRGCPEAASQINMQVACQLFSFTRWGQRNCDDRGRDMILVCGEALVDLFVGPADGGALPGRAVAGGSPFNVAIGLRRLGVASGFCGGLSQDVFGRHLAGLLRAEGVDLAHAVETDRLTTISVVSTDAHGVPSYAFHGEGKADRMVTPADLPSALPDSVQALTFGSYTLAVDPVGAAYLTLARREAGRRIISIDPNVRPTVTPDMGQWRARFEAFADLADIIKASDEDIRLAYGEGADIETVARGWLGRGAGLVVVTRGSEGALGLTARERVTVPGRAVTVVDTVGAGDTFHAALLVRLSALGLLSKDGLARLDSAALEAAMWYACTAASITCSRRGADLPRAADVAVA